MKPSIMSKQVPPFWQGFAWQASMACWQREPVKPLSQTQR